MSKPETTIGWPPTHKLPSGAYADWPGATSVPPTCVGCGLPILPTSFGRGEVPTTHTRYIGNRGPFHLGCSDVKP